jgi:hypothetical protein
VNDKDRHRFAELVACTRLERMTMSPTDFVNTLVGPFGLSAALGTLVALFAGFLYLFNYTSFF